MVNNIGSSPVFLVGASRSGITLLQEALSLHSQLNISSETHWFDDDCCLRDSPIKNAQDRRQAQDWFLSLAHKPFGYSGNPEQGWLAREAFEFEAQGVQMAAPRDAYFVAWCKLDASRAGKPRWGEKTPRHVFRINDILQALPDAKILCCIRYAPAMVASYKQWSLRPGHDIKDVSTSEANKAEKLRARASYHPAIAAMLWRGAVRNSLRAQQLFGDDCVKLVFYEQMVLHPESTLSEISNWLGEKFEPQTLNVPMVNSSFDEHKSGAGFVAETLNRWKQHLSAGDCAVIQLLCGKELSRLGYEPVSQWYQLWRAVPAMLSLPVAVWRAARANTDRTGNLLPYIWRRVKPGWL